MKYLRKLNENFDEYEIQSYTSDVIKDINQIGSVYSYSFELLDFNNKEHIFDIDVSSDNEEYYKFFLDKKLIVDDKRHQNSFLLSDWKHVILLIEKNLRIIKMDAQTQIKDKMFEVITKDLLEDYFACITDCRKYIIEKTKLISSNYIFWSINISIPELKYLGDRSKNYVLDKNYIELMDNLISTSLRLKDIFDVTVSYRFNLKTIVINIFANDEDGNPIGEKLLP